MPAKILDGVALAEKSRADTQRRAADMRTAGRPVRLVALLVGEPPGAVVYASRQAESCRAVGIEYELEQFPAEATFKKIAKRIDELNADRRVTGIMLHLPLPKKINPTEMQARIDPRKDVEGVSPANIGFVIYGHTLIAPCTARAAIELIDASGVELEGAEACVVGASEIAGKPTALLLAQRRATVTICQKETRDLESHTREAEVLVVAAGRPNLIGPEHVRAGACVIDIGINRVTTLSGKMKTVGDVDFERVREKAGWISPVPGGVGPMTVAMLLSNTVRSAEILARESSAAEEAPA
jgi:methylenetetrahydrofolate dehydrogenase (NADP+)/methenyltetrahydrofolate cyclohydrolase